MNAQEKVKDMNERARLARSFKARFKRLFEEKGMDVKSFCKKHSKPRKKIFQEQISRIINGNHIGTWETLRRYDEALKTEEAKEAADV